MILIRACGAMLWRNAAILNISLQNVVDTLNVMIGN
jgi:hypothetical protein